MRVILNRVFRDGDTQQEYCAKLSIDLGSVMEWEEYVYEGVFKKYTQPKTTITVRDDHYVILMGFEQFDKLMYSKQFPNDCLEIPISLN